ncbi:SpaH/EbpB family LPXTG-anchored major pilin [Lacticaseibacillus nasuensis]|uniref:SpaH/EbpB family LPXTG-anchored major pilin n=1 Tax=Lacticaseibacillus nasuensis TaxID=944671 RepID=UPI00224549D7|nr:SpaH/EbpB family LPXTG-anchored major pilin [Lacticaseibacillus nasuensis]MCX2454731.1 SpaH/EbpB family LPXTG-anchored major pilin [Lacticaseibacillus nasuensis]
MGSKFKHLIASVLLSLPLALQAAVGGQAVTAAEATGDNAYIAVHKLAFNDGTKVPTIQSGTTPLTDLQGGQLMNGVEFTAYDVTSAYNTLKGSTSDRQTELKDNASKYATKDTVFGKPQTTAGTGDAAGTASFTLPVKTDAGKYAVYLLMETKSKTDSSDGNVTTVKVADPIVLVMPLMDNGTEAKPVNVYPKNETKTGLTKDLTDPKTDADDTRTDDPAVAKALGDTVDYTATVVVPSDIANLDQFVVTDTPQVGLNIVTDSVKISAATDGTDTTPLPEATIAYTDATADQGAGFTATYQPAALAKFAGTTLTMTYSATINKLLTPGGALLTNEIKLNNQPNITSKTNVTTGGAKFVKQDADDSNKTLAGAEFIVLNKDKSKYLTKTGTDGTDAKYGWVDYKAGQTDFADNVVKLTSDAKGAFAITGLAYGDYHLVETKAPDGYAVAQDPYDFTVTSTSYTKDDAIAVKDAPKGLLPATGGMGIYLIILIGLALIAAGYAFLRHGKHRHQEV